MTKLDFQPGDIVKLQGEVDRVSSHFVCIRTKSSGSEIWVFDSEIDMVKRAARKPKVGDVITPTQIKDTPWKRGTLFRSILPEAPPNWFMAVRGDGHLELLGRDDPESFTFDEYYAASTRPGEPVWQVVFLP